MLFLFTFISRNFLPMVDEHTFYLFKSAKGAGNSVIPSLEVSLKFIRLLRVEFQATLDVGIEAVAIRIISFRCPGRLLVSNFSRP